jgi:hypothetical protein
MGMKPFFSLNHTATTLAIAVMSVEQTDKIDFISTSPEGEVFLTISDHLLWDEDGHLPLLQDKINAYLEFIDSEQLLEEYPAANKRPVVISVYMQFDPTEEAIFFFNHVRNVLAERSIEFCWKVVSGQ